MKTQADTVKYRLTNNATIIERTPINEREHVVICKWGAFEFVTWIAICEDGTGRMDAHDGHYYHSLVNAADDYAKRIANRKAMELERVVAERDRIGR